MNPYLEAMIVQLKELFGITGAPLCNGDRPIQRVCECACDCAKTLAPKTDGVGDFFGTVFVWAIIIACIKYCN